MKVLTISLDRKIFEPGSAVRSRLLEYGRLVEELHVIVFAKMSCGFNHESFPPNIFLYPTNTKTRLGYILRAIIIAYNIKRSGVIIDVVSPQDPFETGLAAFLISRSIKARLHLQIHTDFKSRYFREESLFNRIRGIIAEFLIPRANAIRVVSKRIKNSLPTTNYKLPTITVLPIFIDISAIEGTPISQSIKKKYPQFKKHILMASRLTREKNIEMAIEAMREIVQKYPKTGLIIVGNGPEQRSLISKTKNYKLESNIIFEAWQNNLVSYYKTADLFLLTSNYEGYGMTVIEALAAGCSVIMTDVGCAGEIVQSEENGLVVPVNDKVALSSVIDRVLSGGANLVPKLPKMLTKEEYLASYKKSWEDAL